MLFKRRDPRSIDARGLKQRKRFPNFYNEFVARKRFYQVCVSPEWTNSPAAETQGAGFERSYDDRDRSGFASAVQDPDVSGGASHFRVGCISWCVAVTQSGAERRR